MSTSRSGTVTLCGVLVGIATLTGAPANADYTATGTPYPLTTELTVAKESQMTYANGRLFVSEGHNHSDVQVYTPAGELVADITGEPGASSMVVAPDRKTVFVADSAGDTISAIDTATLTHTQFTVDACPASLALAAGRLFYSFGCASTGQTSGVSSIDPTIGGTPTPASHGLSKAPLLIGAGSTVVEVRDPAIKSFSADTTGELTAEGTGSFSGGKPHAISITPDGLDVLVGASLTEYDAATFHLVRRFSPHRASVGAIAVSPAGTHLLVGVVSPSSGYQFALYQPTLDAPLWRRTVTTISPTTWRVGVGDEPMPETLTFSDDGSTVYGLVRSGFGQSWLFASELAPTATTMKMALASSHAGTVHTATVTVSAPGVVTFLGTVGRAPQPGQPRPERLLGTAKINARGVATKTFHTPYSGTIWAVFEGSDSALPAHSINVPFNVAPKAGAVLSGSYATKDHVELFRHATDVHVVLSMSPSHLDRHLVVAIERRADGTWRTIRRRNIRMTHDDDISLRLSSANSDVDYRFELSFAGDSFNSKAHAISRTFEVV
jgi:DNA-binding beta-propeller fold protein YncE